MVGEREVRNSAEHADGGTGSRGPSLSSRANPTRVGGKALLCVLCVLGILLAVGIIGPMFSTVQNSKPPKQKDASWVEGMLREALSEAQDGGAGLPQNAAEFNAMISSSDADFLLRRSVVECEDISPGAVLIRIDTPPGDFKALRYERNSDNEYQIAVVPVPRDEGG